jgi:PPM family protein phosphatase
MSEGVSLVPGDAPASVAGSDTATRVIAAGLSDPGRVRAVNQDAFWSGEVGLEGVPGGGRRRHGRPPDRGGRQSAGAGRRSGAARGRDARPPARRAGARRSQAANLQVHALATERPEHQGMGTTLTALLIDDQVGFVGHVGDSRAYRLRDGALEQLTHDHSWVADRVRQGLLSSEEARRHRWRNVITNAFGAGPRFRLDLGTVDVRAGDRFLLCSDGVSMMVSEGLMTQILTDHPPAGRGRRADRRGQRPRQPRQRDRRGGRGRRGRAASPSATSCRPPAPNPPRWR